MQIIKTTDPAAKPSLVMLVYGNGGVGKTTFASTAPKPLLVDCENGAKYFGLRGIKMDVAKIANWSDMAGLFDIAKSGEYETIIIDPIGELMEKLKRYMIAKGDKKNVQSDGSPSMAGWGWLKDTMRDTLKILRDTGVNLLIVAHVEEKDVEGQLVKRPKVMTKISEDLIAFVDVVGYMRAVQIKNEETEQMEIKRIINVQPTDQYEAKDRTNQLGIIVPPNFLDILDACQGNKTFKWSSEEALKGKGSVDNDVETGEKGESKKDEMNDQLKKAGKKAVKKTTKKII
jgi:phage nucleotide-binding protein